MSWSFEMGDLQERIKNKGERAAVLFVQFWLREAVHLSFILTAKQRRKIYRRLLYKDDSVSAKVL